MPPVIGNDGDAVLADLGIADRAGSDLERRQGLDEAGVQGDLGVDAGQRIDLGDRLDVVGGRLVAAGAVVAAARGDRERERGDHQDRGAEAGYQ